MNEAEGFVSAEYGMVYPPGIPFLVPGEKITKTVLDKIENAKKAGLHLFGFADAARTDRAGCERRKEKVKRGFYHGQIVCIYGEKVHREKIRFTGNCWRITRRFMQ